MLAAIVRFSIRYYGIVILLSFVVMVYGGYRFLKAGLDIFPEFSPNLIIIQTEASGLSAEQVEILVTQQIEMSLNGLTALKSLRSESIQGLSIVTALFEEDSEIHLNRQRVNARMANLKDKLPAGAGTPLPVPLSSSSATILTLGLSSDTKSLMELRSLVDWTIVPRLLSVPGVADINTFGGEIRQLQIQVNPVKLRQFQLETDDIVYAARRAASINGGGFLENENQRFTIQVSGQPTTPEQFEKIIIKHVNGQSITLGDVTTIRFAPEPSISAAQIMGTEGIVMMVIGQYGANTSSVSEAVEKVIIEFNNIFSKQGINFYPNLFRPADYIETSFTNLSGHLLIGALFVILVLFVFLYDIRTACISALAIPVSLISAVILLLETGTNLNIMVLGGLAIALGEVVDDAIIDTENIFRRLRINQSLPKPLPTCDVVYSASMEVRGSVVYATLIVALVFVPLLTLDGIAGRLFAPLGLSYILAILMSLIVALTLTPALCYVFLGKKHNQQGEPPIIKYLNPWYRSLLVKVYNKFVPICVISGAICFLAIVSAFNLENKFLPELREGHYIVHTSSIPGTSLKESIRIGSRLTEQFLKIPGVISVSQWAGRAERGADTYGSHYSEYEVRLSPVSGARQAQVLKRLRKILSDFPGIVFEANTFLTERIDETISGYTSPVVVNVYGNNFATIDNKARAIAEIMRTIPGAVDIQLRSHPASPAIKVQIKPDQLNTLGLFPDQIVSALQTAYETHVVGKNIQGNRIYDIAVALQPELRERIEYIGELPLETMNGKSVTISQVADIQLSEGRYNILHQNAQRIQTVTCNVSDGNLDAFMHLLKQRVFNEISFPANSYPEFTGAAEEQSKARNELILHSLLAGTGVLILIYVAIGNLRHVLICLANLPFSFIGGIAAVILTGGTLSIGSVVGFVTLFGITVRNSIMLVSHYQYLIESEGRLWNLETALQGAQERLPSILMTALVTALAMFPIAFDSDNAGREIMGPMAAIIIGGLASSTLLNLLLLPCMLLNFGQFTPKKDLEGEYQHP